MTTTTMMMRTMMMTMTTMMMMYMLMLLMMMTMIMMHVVVVVDDDAGAARQFGPDAVDRQPGPTRALPAVHCDRREPSHHRCPGCRPRSEYDVTLL